MDYKEFLSSKQYKIMDSGFNIQEKELNKNLFPFQRRITQKAIQRGRYAVLIDCGLGKSIIQLEWCNQIVKQTGGKALIIAPLSVAHQTISEGEKFGIVLTYAESQEAVTSDITITNYERLERFDPAAFTAIVLDESSIIKSVAGKIKNNVFDMFKDTPYKLSCSATPAPNDITELANQAEFLGVMSRTEMLSKFFVHDQDGWRIKGHARGGFYKWVSQWAVMARKPSDIGFSDEGFSLPELNIEAIWTDDGYIREGELFATTELKGITDRIDVRKKTIISKAEKIKHFVESKPDEQFLIWCGLDLEADCLERVLAGSVQLSGKQMKSDKIREIEDFKSGKIRILITKVKIAGLGMNFQNCHNMIFFGLNDSWESYYQGIRRVWRYGQRKPVEVRIVLNPVESTILENVRRKERHADDLFNGIVSNVSEFNKIEMGVLKMKGKDLYNEEYYSGKDWELYNGDSSEVIKKLADNSIDLSVFSPPFSSLYTYSPSDRDMGNCKSDSEFWEHFSFLSSELLRVMKPGRIICCHVSQIPAMLVRDGYIGLKDFRGDTIKHFTNQGFIYHGEVCIDKNPQAQSIRTHAKGLTFSQLEKDSSWMRPALADYILLFRKPGENAVEIVNGNREGSEVGRDEWITLAHPIWYNIRETETLNVREARSDDDEKHIAPLQLETIRRCVLMWSNKGETVLSPFAGIGSEGYVSLRLKRKFIGIELKKEYALVAKKNLEKQIEEGRLFKSDEVE
jgi:DNA modification methylase